MPTRSPARRPDGSTRRASRHERRSGVTDVIVVEDRPRSTQLRGRSVRLARGRGVRRPGPRADRPVPGRAGDLDAVPRVHQPPAHRASRRSTRNGSGWRTTARRSTTSTSRGSLKVRCGTCSARRSSARPCSASRWPGCSATGTAWLRRLLELTVVFAWIIPSSVVAYLWRAYLAEDGTLNAIIPGNTALADRAPVAVDHRVQHVARHGVLDAAVRGGDQLAAAVVPGDRPPRRGVDPAAAHRRRAAVDQGLHPHQPAADQPVDVQRLRPVPADRQRPRPQHPGALGVHVHRRPSPGRTSSATGRPSPRSS